MKFITIGELLMRLSPPDYEKIRTTSSYVVNFGGAEANVAVSLANLGVDTTVFTVLPDNDIGRSAVRSLKANDVCMMFWRVWSSRSGLITVSPDMRDHSAHTYTTPLQGP